MSKRDGFHRFCGENGLALPQNEAERKEAVRLLFGLELISSVDYWIEMAQHILQQHDEFADFTEEQKAAALALVSTTAYGTLFGHCVQFDQPDIEIHYIERDDEDGDKIRSTPIAGASEDELHHAYHDWAERFGDYYDSDSLSRFSLRKA